MNIKECRKSLMIVKDIESDIISEAYFILKNDSEDESKISEEAERIIRECGERAQKKRRVKNTALRALLVSAVTAIAVTAVVFVFMLF